jgi:starch synthase
MKVLFASAECAPFFKTGGLGDVAGALPKALKEKGVEISVVLPFFTAMPQHYQEASEEVTHFYIKMGIHQQYCGIRKLELDQVVYYFIENPDYFDRENLYSYEDDGERFAFFSLAIIEMLTKMNIQPDFIHCNDHHTAIIPFLLKEKYQNQAFCQELRTILTIHNIEFQGKYPQKMLPEIFDLPLAEFEQSAVLDQTDLNFLKAGILYADRVTTVSPTYAEEIQTPEFGCGLDVVLQQEQGKLSGILNGIDYELNDPATDSLIPAHFTTDDLAGKAMNKQALQEKMGLPVQADIPLIGVVSRLTHQKGFPLVLEAFEKLLKHPVQIVILGTGDPALEEQFKALATAYPEKVSTKILFDLSLAQLIYAGSDLFLMPSKFEPCGLSQLIAMRYGTIPLVHATGGLKDTVLPFQPETGSGTGFSFIEYTPEALISMVNTALSSYQTANDWQTIIQNAMAEDFSWSASSEAYVQLYKQC